VKFTKNDFKLFMIVTVAVIAVLLLAYAGDKYDIPVLKQAHEGAGG